MKEGAVYGIIDPDYGRVYTIVRKLAWSYAREAPTTNGTSSIKRVHGYVL